MPNLDVAGSDLLELQPPGQPGTVGRPLPGRDRRRSGLQHRKQQPVLSERHTQRRRHRHLERGGRGRAGSALRSRRSTPVVANQRPVYWRSTAAGTGQARAGHPAQRARLGQSSCSTRCSRHRHRRRLLGGGPLRDRRHRSRRPHRAPSDDPGGLRGGEPPSGAVKFDSSLNAHDAAWYNVSTLSGGLPESATTEAEAAQRYSGSSRTSRRSGTRAATSTPSTSTATTTSSTTGKPSASTTPGRGSRPTSPRPRR